MKYQAVSLEPSGPSMLELRGSAYVKTVSPTNHQNQGHNDVILDCIYGLDRLQSRIT